MQKRIRFQKMLIGGLAFVIAIMLATLLLGRNDTIPVLIINSNEIDISKPLSEQQSLLKEEKMALSEYELFSGAIATSFNDIKGKKLKIQLKKGTPVILSALADSDSAGAFAATTAVYHTIFKMPDVASSLPPGLQAGDLLDINLLIEKTKPNKEKQFVIGPLLKNVKIASVDKEKATIYLLVSQKNYDILSVSRKMGSFVVQLPGQKDVGTCDDVRQNINDERDKEIERLKTKDKTFKKLTKEEQNKRISELEKDYQFRLATAECYSASDIPNTITSDTILEIIENANMDDIFSEDDPFNDLDKYQDENLNENLNEDLDEFNEQ